MTDYRRMMSPDSFHEIYNGNRRYVGKIDGGVVYLEGKFTADFLQVLVNDMNAVVEYLTEHTDR